MSRVTMPIAFSCAATERTLPQPARRGGVRSSTDAARERVDQLLLEPGEIREDGELAIARLVHVELERVGLLGDVEERSQDEAGVVQRPEPAVRLVVG